MIPEADTLAHSSVRLLAEAQSSTGAWVAAPRYRPYRYSWVRDGAFIAEAMDAAGNHAEARAFHEWVARTVLAHRRKVEALLETPVGGRRTGDPLSPLPDRHVLHTRYTVDGAEGPDPWGNFQLDGYGFWLTSLVRHLETTGADPVGFVGAVGVVVDYLVATWDMPCYDAWEEFPTRQHATTLAAVCQGLRSVDHIGTFADAGRASDAIDRRLRSSVMPDGALPKHVDTADASDLGEDDGSPSAVAGHERVGRQSPPDAIDGSALLVLGDHGPFEPADPLVGATLARIVDDLYVGGGVHRYLGDEFYGGGLWVVLAGALACLEATDDAITTEAIAWIESTASELGTLPEQSDASLLSPAGLDLWRDRWGDSADPLLWSHAMYVLARSRGR